MAVTQAEEGTVPAKVTAILLGMSGFDLSSPAILLEPETVNSNYTLYSWLVSLYSLHTSLWQVPQPFLIHLPWLYIARFAIKMTDTLPLCVGLGFYILEVDYLQGHPSTEGFILRVFAFSVFHCCS